MVNIKIIVFISLNLMMIRIINNIINGLFKRSNFTVLNNIKCINDNCKINNYIENSIIVYSMIKI